MRVFYLFIYYLTDELCVKKKKTKQYKKQHQTAFQTTSNVKNRAINEKQFFFALPQQKAMSLTRLAYVTGIFKGMIFHA